MVGTRAKKPVNQAGKKVRPPKPRVLVVEGDARSGSALTRDFDASVWEVETTSATDQLLAKVATSAPDLIVLDLDLPDDGALTLLREWKKRAPQQAVVVVSATASLATVVDALKEGACRFFIKPVSSDALVGELEQQRNPTQVPLSPLMALNHQLGRTSRPAGLDRVFAISLGLMSVAGFDGFWKALSPSWEKTLGRPLAELYTTPMLDLIHPDDRDKNFDEAMEMRGGQPVFRFKNRYQRQDGSYRWLAWTATASPDEQVVYASARDITKTVRAEQGLRRTNHDLGLLLARRGRSLQEATLENQGLHEQSRLKDELAAMVVHELKNPLSVIVANHDYVLEDFDGSEDCLDALQDARTAGLRMLRLLAKLGNAAHVDSSQEATTLLEVPTGAVPATGGAPSRGG